MEQQSVYYVGTHEEVAHHARPIIDSCDVRIARPEEVVVHAQRGDLAIFFSEHFRRFRDTVRTLRQRDVATLYAIDGILEWRNAWENLIDEPASPFTMRPVLSHKVATIGPSQTRILNAWGNQDKTETVGLPRLDRLRDSGPREADGMFNVLVVSAKCPGFTPAQVDCAKRAFRDVKRWFDNHPELKGRKVVTTWRLTQSLADDVGVENAMRDMTGDDMATALSQADALITTPSTAMLEGMLQGIPVALLDYNVCPHYVPAAWEILSPQHLDSILPELVEPSTRKLAWQKTLLQDALACESPATPRLEQLITSMLKTAGECIRDERPLTFPSQMLPASRAQIDASHAGFDHQAMYPQSEELGGHDLVETQIALADAHRVIGQLDAEIAQLKSELGQAHEIFDQIHQHPIAGPIVRTRQRLIDWMARRRQGSIKHSVEPSLDSKNGRTT